MRYPYVPGARGRDTSVAAAESMRIKASTLRSQTLAAFKAVEDSGDRRGLTADEAAFILGKTILSIRPRVAELARLDEIEDSGDRRRNQSGRPAIVWRRKTNDYDFQSA